MSNQEKEQVQEQFEKRQAEYKKLGDLRKDTEKRLNEVRKQTLRVIETRKAIEKYRREELKDIKENFKEAIKNKDKSKIKKFAKNIVRVENELKNAKKLSLQSKKIMSLTKTNQALNERINERMGIMAMREAKARNAFTRASARIYNKFSGIKLNHMLNKSDKQQLKLKNSIKEYNKKYQTAFTYKRKLMNDSLNIQKQNVKSNNFTSVEAYKKRDIVNKNFVKDYQKTVEKGKNTYSKNNVKVIDNGNSLSVKGGTIEQQNKIMLDVAQAKGWDLEKIEVSGSKEFKAEFKKQKNEILAKQKGTDYTNVNKDLEKNIKKEADKIPATQTQKIENDGSSLAYANMYKELEKLKRENADLKEKVKQQEKPKTNNFDMVEKQKAKQVDIKEVAKKQQEEKKQQNSIGKSRY